MRTRSISSSTSWYAVDSSRLLYGGPNPEVMETARQDHVPLMPLVVNLGLVQEEVHKFFANPTGASKPSPHTTQSLRRAMRFCEKHGYRRCGKTKDFFGKPLIEYQKALL